jgi:hypothetical protein
MGSSRLLSGIALAAIIAATTGLRARGADDRPTLANATEHDQHMAAKGQMEAPPGAVPLLPGQDAFGAVQEIVHILEADPKTNWSKVDLELLRRHLVDMNEVTLKAEVVQRPVDGGIEATVTGSGRTLDAIRRMVPAHLHEIDVARQNGWRAQVADIADGVVATVTSTDPKEVDHLRGLGFIGVMVSGPHHQLHHLAMARGQMAH